MDSPQWQLYCIFLLHNELESDKHCQTSVFYIHVCLLRLNAVLLTYSYHLNIINQYIKKYSLYI